LRSAAVGARDPLLDAIQRLTAQNWMEARALMLAPGAGT
jgi:hypothetical protein